jgi:hypothetical protein
MALSQFQLSDVPPIAYAAIGSVGLGLLAWKKSRRWEAERSKAWTPELVVDAESFTRFQRLTEAAVLAHFQALNLPAPERSVDYARGEHDGEAWVTLTVPSVQLNVDLSPDQVNVYGAGFDWRIESAGEPTPDAARQGALVAIDRLVARTAAHAI